MKGRTLTAVLMLFMLAVICFVSVPVQSGDHPWDRDDPADDKDTVVVDNPDTVIVDEDNPPDWWLLLYQSSLYIITGTIII